MIIWIALLLMIYPVLWIIMSSFSKGDSFFLTSLFPKDLSFDTYEKLFTTTGFIQWVLNSLLLCISVAVIQLFLTCTAAYAFSRMRFPGRKYGLMSLLVLQVFPSSMALAAYYVIIYKYNLMDNFLVLILILAGGSAYNIWLMKSYIDGLPRELDEAAFVDGAGHWTVFTRIIMPLAVPMLVVIFLFSFIGTYSEFMISSIVLQSPENYTLALGLQTFINNQFSAHWTLFAAASILSSLPVMIIFMLLQKYIQGGLAAGAVKG
ncbi:MAG: sugar ABC transporter permease [Oscillospiraceae bacterium]|nr:sugar ABC transporter permease [Oscillospiraceae bacterium]